MEMDEKQLLRGNEGGEPDPEPTVVIDPVENPTYTIPFKSLDDGKRHSLVAYCYTNDVVYKENPMEGWIKLEVLPDGKLPDWLEVA